MIDKYAHERKIILNIINENYDRFMQNLDAYLDKNLPNIDERKRARLKMKIFQLLAKFDFRSPRAVGADSFRFWEALAAGCAAINIDLAYYGVEMPAMPVNGLHYLGVDFRRVDEFVDQFQSKVDSQN